MDRILVTGADGFMGEPLVRKLGDAGYRVTALTSAAGDIADYQTMGEYDLTAYRQVFHLAARTYVPDSWRIPHEFNRTNIMGTSNVLEACRIYNIPMVYVSAYLYGLPHKLPVCESDPVCPNNPYALSKFMAEQLCEFYAAHYQMNITVIRPFNIYGPGQKSQFLIPTIVEQLGQEKIVVEDTNPRRDYIYIDDVIEALMCSMTAPDGYNVYNIASGYSQSVADITAAILDVAGRKIPVLSREIKRSNEIPDVYASIEKARDELGWVPQVNFSEGVKRILGKL